MKISLFMAMVLVAGSTAIGGDQTCPRPADHAGQTDVTKQLR
jgi:hypothetical protein